MDSPDVEELEALLAEEEQFVEACARGLILARTRIRELEAGLVFSCGVNEDLQRQVNTLTEALDAANQQIASLQAALTHAIAAGDAADAEVARLRAGLATIGAEVESLLGPTPPPGVPVNLIATPNPPVPR